MIQIERFVNELMSSNCYVVWDDVSRHCVIIDPGSEKSLREIEFVDSNSLFLDYIFLTHEHTDHTWGVNALVEMYNPKVVCSAKCKEVLPQAGGMYFRLFYDDIQYRYAVCRVDYTIEMLNYQLDWVGHRIFFLPSPGHSASSMCVKLENRVFSGDTIMQYKPYINKRGGSLGEYKETINKLLNILSQESVIYPGHGDDFPLIEYSNPFC